MPNPPDHPGTTARARACAYCGKGPRVAAHTPFCSAGCQDRDLLQWMSGGYAVPASDNDDELSDAATLDNDAADSLLPRLR